MVINNFMILWIIQPYSYSCAYFDYQLRNRLRQSIKALLSSLRDFINSIMFFVHIDSWRYCLCLWRVTFLTNSKILETNTSDCVIWGKLAYILISFRKFPMWRDTCFVANIVGRSYVFKNLLHHRNSAFIDRFSSQSSLFTTGNVRREAGCTCAWRIWKSNARIGSAKPSAPNSPAEKKQRQNPAEGKIS